MSDELDGSAPFRTSWRNNMEIEFSVALEKRYYWCTFPKVFAVKGKLGFGTFPKDSLMDKALVSPMSTSWCWILGRRCQIVLGSA